MRNLKNFFLRALVKLRPKGVHRSPLPTRILVVSTTALGDTLWAMPGIESLRLSFPEAYIAVLTSPIGMGVLQENPWTNRLFPLAHPLSLWNTLRKERFDTILIFHASQRFIAPLCALLSPQRLIGTKGLNKGLDDLFTQMLPLSSQHEIERRLQLVKGIGGTAHSHTLSFFLTPEEKGIKKKGRLQIALHPGAKDPYKLWPLGHFAATGRKLQEALDCDILITGHGAERPLMEKLAQLIPGSTLCDPNLSLRSFASLLDGMDLLICNDSGPFHLACALNRPAIAVYSPTDPKLCGPHHSQSGIAIYKPRTCHPCLRRECQKPFCLLQIGPDEVVQKAVKTLGGSRC